MNQSIVRQPEQGESLDVVGDRLRILVDSSDTGGKCVVFECITDPGKGPPLHRHGRDDEIFFIVEGTLKFVVDGVESTVSAGGCVLAARGSAHAFVNVGKSPSRMIITCCPGGLERPFREADRLGREGSASLEAITTEFRKFDVEILGPPIQP
jgi:mannose-6-phosphate isomerase-like protein (cupin superfamily)